MKQRWLGCLAVLMIASALRAGSDGVLQRNPGNAYSGSYLYNGFKYKLVTVSEAADPKRDLSIGVATDSSQICPGRPGKCTWVLIQAINEGSQPFDVDPQSFVCECMGKKQKRLDHHKVPAYLLAQSPPGFLLLANTIIPGGSIKGTVIFRGTCSDYVIRVPLTLSGSTVGAIELPFTSNK